MFEKHLEPEQANALLENHWPWILITKHSETVRNRLKSQNFTRINKEIRKDIDRVPKYVNKNSEDIVNGSRVQIDTRTTVAESLEQLISERITLILTRTVKLTCETDMNLVSLKSDYYSGGDTFFKARRWCYNLIGSPGVPIFIEYEADRRIWTTHQYYVWYCHFCRNLASFSW